MRGEAAAPSLGSMMFFICVSACANTASGGEGATDVPAIDRADAPTSEMPEADTLLDVSDAAVPNINCPLGYSYWREDGGVHLERVLLCSESERTRAVCCLATHISPGSLILPYYEASWPVRCVWDTHCQDGGVVGRSPW